ncbi:hypothetical protein Golob_002697 [Gossypium lobatum]|uniref:BAG domain-containing protein n=1 Tax=Gossypium lobatum TaxID=34289 RepID=A0A7J8N696_9ROSI|nr:hypothetical protein [Gossypium lobatum]
MTNTKDNKVEEVKESEELSKAFAAVAGVRKEVDKLSERVAALEVAVNSGTKVTDEEFVVPAELLMRELLKLDGVEAEGEARLQRKAEVRRIQKYHETLDKLKTRNSNPFSDKHKAVSGSFVMVLGLHLIFKPRGIIFCLKDNLILMDSDVMRYLNSRKHCRSARFLDSALAFAYSLHVQVKS